MEIVGRVCLATFAIQLKSFVNARSCRVIDQATFADHSRDGTCRVSTPCKAEQIDCITGLIQMAQEFVGLFDLIHRSLQNPNVLM